MARRVAVFRTYVTGRPVFCTWQLTRHCASLCLFCEHRLEGGDAELDLAGCRRVVAQLDRMGSMVVSLSGGDPFLRGDLADVIRLLAARHVPVLATHGWLVNEGSARAAWDAGLAAAAVRLFAASPSGHDDAVGLPGAHARALAGLRALARTRTAERQLVSLSVPLLAEEALEELLVLAAAEGATVTVEAPFPLAGGGGASTRLMRLKRRYPHLLSSSAYLRRLDEALGGGVPSCRAGRSFVNVDHRGRVSKCAEYRGAADHAGNLATEDLDAVLPRLRRKAEENACTSCWYAFRGEVESLYGARGLLRALPLLVGA